jgi:ATP-binding cassette subfamily B protein
MNTTGRRLLRYALLYKKPIIGALLLMLLAVSAELVGPFFAKRMIDDHIMGIQNVWHETTSEDRYSIPYGDSRYKRIDRFAEGETPGAPARVLQIGGSYYFVRDAVDVEGEMRVEDGMLIVRPPQGEAVAYPAEKLSNGDVYRFYQSEFPMLLVLSAIYFGLMIGGAVLTYFQRYVLQVSANKIIRRIRNDVFAHIQRLPVRYFDHLPAGKIVSRVTNDTEAIRELFVNVLANFFSGIVYICAILGALFLLDWRLAAVSLPILPLLYAWIVIYRKFAHKFNHVIRSRLSDINAIINESIQGMSIIQAFRREKQTESEFEDLNEDYLRQRNKLLRLNSLTSHNLVNVVRNLFFLLALWMFAGSWFGASLTIGMLYAFIDYIGRMMQPVVGIVNQLANLETARVSAERVFELLDEEGDEVSEERIARYRGDVRFENVYFAYKEGEYVLKDISFSVRQGETVALVGHTGSGKSSILNLLFRFYEANSGTITIDGIDVRKMTKQALRQHMGIVLQDPFLFTGTIASNVSLDHPDISREKVEQALKDVGAYDMFMQLPGGLDEPVIEKGSTLSAGQRQLISFARALAFDPAILILDEATASIDSETEAIIQQALEVLKRGRTTFVIAHRLSTIRAADQILVLDHGRIVERGNHDELMAMRGKYYAMYQMQLGGKEVVA